MDEIFKLSCSCGKHDFVFPVKPWCETEVKCPECGQVFKYDPEEKPVKKTKESDK